MNILEEKYQHILNKVKRTDPQWYLDIERELYDRINSCADSNDYFTAIYSIDSDNISNAVFKDPSRITVLQNILQEVGFMVYYEPDGYDHYSCCDSAVITISWATITL